MADFAVSLHRHNPQENSVAESYKKRAETAEARVSELETTAEKWKILASEWRKLYHQAMDTMVGTAIADINLDIEGEDDEAQ